MTHHTTTPDLIEREALLPCPFCGSPASIQHSQHYDYVACDECDAETVGFESTEAAVAQWNRRAIPAAQDGAEVEALAAERDALKAEVERKDAEIARLMRLIRLAHPLMRETGWHLAPWAEVISEDGILEYACAEVEEEFGAALRAEQKGGA